jgi:hypothetical protein
MADDPALVGVEAGTEDRVLVAGVVGPGVAGGLAVLEMVVMGKVVVVESVWDGGCGLALDALLRLELVEGRGQRRPQFC